jgi:hypothetical protein
MGTKVWGIIMCFRRKKNTYPTEEEMKFVIDRENDKFEWYSLFPECGEQKRFKMGKDYYHSPMSRTNPYNWYHELNLSDGRKFWVHEGRNVKCSITDKKCIEGDCRICNAPVSIGFIYKKEQ